MSALAPDLPKQDMGKYPHTVDMPAPEYRCRHRDCHGRGVALYNGGNAGFRWQQGDCDLHRGKYP